MYPVPDPHCLPNLPLGGGTPIQFALDYTLSKVIKPSVIILLSDADISPSESISAEESIKKVQRKGSKFVFLNFSEQNLRLKSDYQGNFLPGSEKKLLKGLAAYLRGLYV